jgi:hypothetical protein
VALSLFFLRAASGMIRNGRIGTVAREDHRMSKLTDSLREGANALLDKAADWQELIRERAQAIWEREGRPEGRHDEHWHAAEKEIAAEESAAVGARKKPAVKTPTKETAGPNPVRRTAAKGSAPIADAATAREVSESAAQRSRDE